MNRRPAPSLSHLQGFEPTSKEAAEHQRKLIAAEAADNPDFQRAKRDLDIQRGDILPDGTPRVLPTAKDVPSITLKVLRQGARENKQEEAPKNEEPKPPAAVADPDETIIDKRVPRHPELVARKRHVFLRIAVCVVGLGLLGWFIASKLFRDTAPERVSADARMTTTVAGATATATATAIPVASSVRSSSSPSSPFGSESVETAHKAASAVPEDTTGRRKPAPPNAVPSVELSAPGMASSSPPVARSASSSTKSVPSNWTPEM